MKSLIIIDINDLECVGCVLEHVLPVQKPSCKMKSELATVSEQSASHGVDLSLLRVLQPRCFP